MKYSAKYEDPLIRGVQEGKPWDIVDELRKIANKNKTLLDVGCGTAIKLTRLRDHFSHIYGIEPNKNMRQKAIRNILNDKIDNISILLGDKDEIPFKNALFDYASVMLAPHDTKELSRILKPGGIALVEKIGEQDKESIKKYFGKDHLGYRGRYLHYTTLKRTKEFKAEFQKFFSKVEVYNESWDTYYSEEGLKLLLAETNTVRDYDLKRDSEIVKKIIQELTTEKGIYTKQNRILIKAIK